MNSEKRITDRRRPDALAQLKAAQKMLASGRQELANAHKKIEEAQALIDDSAEILRRTFTQKVHHN
jgi:hypothetical protein